MALPQAVFVVTSPQQQELFSSGQLLVRVSSTSSGGTRRITNEQRYRLPLPLANPNGVQVATNFGDLLTVVVRGLRRLPGVVLRDSIAIQPTSTVYQIEVLNANGTLGTAQQTLARLCQAGSRRCASKCPRVQATVQVPADAARSPTLRIIALRGTDGTAAGCLFTSTALTIGPVTAPFSAQIGQPPLALPADFPGAAQVEVILWGGGGYGFGGGGGGGGTYEFCLPYATAASWLFEASKIGTGGTTSSTGPTADATESVLSIYDSPQRGTLLAQLTAWAGASTISAGGGGAGLAASGSGITGGGNGGILVNGGVGGSAPDPTVTPLPSPSIENTAEVILPAPVGVLGAPVGGQYITPLFLAALSPGSVLVYAPGAGGGSSTITEATAGGSVARLDGTVVPGGAINTGFSGLSAGGGAAVAGADIGLPGTGGSTANATAPGPGGGGSFQVVGLPSAGSTGGSGGFAMRFGS